MHNYTLEKTRAKSQDTSGQQNVILCILKHLFHTLESTKEFSVARQGRHIHTHTIFPATGKAVPSKAIVHAWQQGVTCCK